jgi:peptidoglycan/LPS O-acetylase OafA/YrhL
MGTLRTLFAIAVVFAHSLGNLLVGGQNAVQLFYMISGFLISYVLVERRAYPRMVSFYINRYLRLYPIYFVVAIFTFAAFAITFGTDKELSFFEVYNKAPYAANIFLVASNITLIFQDWVMFAGVESNQLVFTTDFMRSEVVLYPALLVPQAWTLGVELTFYFLAPFILFKIRIIIALLAASTLLRVYLIYIGLGAHDPWTYRFFPTELALFLLGALAHQVLLPLYKMKLSKIQIEKYSRKATYSLVVITLVFSFIPVSEISKTAALFVLFLFMLPLTFIFQSNRGWDKWIGNLSYPIYIGHMFVIYITKFLVGKMGVADKLLIFGKSVPVDRLFVGFGAAIFSIGFAIILNNFVGDPVESLRDRFRAKN